MRAHFVAIGGSAMHNLALALHKEGYEITGSDDEILEPSRGRLLRAGLLPVQTGWFPEKLDPSIDFVILGMHARADNPELVRAKELGLKIFSYPEFLYEASKNKLRVVIGGSHGKTSITAMILHVLKFHGKEFDYMVGAQLEGFDTMVKISDSAPVIILEGDEYLSSPIDRRPKFHLYHPHIALLSGIAWDHINVFPTFDNYAEQFRIFTRLIEPNGTLIYCDRDNELIRVAADSPSHLDKIPYGIPEHKTEDGITFLKSETGWTPLMVFGEHNLMNLEGARLVLERCGVNSQMFHEAVSSFKGAARRLELVMKNLHTAVYKDFAHSPSKLKATTSAVKKQFPGRKLVACMELHTFSSLNENFLSEYNGSMQLADKAYVYFNPHTIEHKKMKPVTKEQVKEAFGGRNLEVFTDSAELVGVLKTQNWENSNLLMMSSGNFDGVDLSELAVAVLK